MPEEATAYLQKHSVRPIIADMLDACCRETPEIGQLTPFLLTQIKEQFPAAAKLTTVEASAMQWKATKKVITDKSDLSTYLADIGWNALMAALMERVLYDRPANVPSFLFKLLATGDTAAPDVDKPVLASGDEGGTLPDMA